VTDPVGSAEAQESEPGPPPSVELASALTQMAGLVLSRETVQTALELVTKLAATTTPGSMGAAVTVVDDSGKRSRAASNQSVERADALQYELDEGPCLTAWRTQEVVRIDDTTTDGRWPRWNEAASTMGVRSVLSAPLLGTGEPIGAMKVYSARPLSYGPHEEHVLLLLAEQAAILLANSQSLQEARQLSRRLTAALAGRDVVSQAIGVLLARGAAGQDAAFATLTGAARRSHHTVEEVARALLVRVTEGGGRVSGS
jgi:GAF domain-containing protein